MNSGIYSITQVSTGHRYVGSAKSLSARWGKHRSDLNLKRHHCKKLQKAWSESASNDFQFEVIEFCSLEKLVEREQFFIDEIKPFFNTLKKARSALGYRHRQESIEKMKMPRLDLSGERFGRLVAIEVSGRNSSGRFMWRCVCDCGSEKNVGASKLKSGHTTSCGCLRSELTGARSAKRQTTHGMTNSKTFTSWVQMKSKCLSPSSVEYPMYGGQGIGICDRWLESFENFLADMGERPDKKCLSRRDFNKDFDRENCYWATRSEIAKRRCNDELG